MQQLFIVHFLIIQCILCANEIIIIWKQGLLLFKFIKLTSSIRGHVNKTKGSELRIDENICHDIITNLHFRVMHAITLYPYMDIF